MPSNVCKDTIHFVGGLGTRAGAALAGGGCVANLFSGNLNDYMDANGGLKKTATSLFAMNNGSGKVRLSKLGPNLVLNGNFSETEIPVWEKTAGSGWSIQVGHAEYVNPQETIDPDEIYQTIALDWSKTYRFSFSVPYLQQPCGTYFQAWLGGVAVYITEEKEYSVDMIPDEDMLVRVRAGNIGTADSAYIDNISVRENLNPLLVLSGLTIGTLVRVNFPSIYQSGVFEILASHDDYIDINLDYDEEIGNVSIYAGGAFPTAIAAYTDNSTLRAAVDNHAYNRLLLDYHNISRNPTDDPFTQVYNGLWDLLELNTELASLVKIGNRIKCTSDGKGDKEKYTNSDLPEIIIRPAAGTSEIKSTSTHTQITQTYAVICTSGDLHIDKSFFPVKWAILNALTDATNCLNLQFVRQVILEDSIDGRNTERFPGWNTAFNIKVEMWFKIA
jgi:hypothetical protein